MKNEKSRELTAEFNRFYPGGHTNYRVPLQVTENRLFLSRAQGARLWDVDGNEYVDYLGAMGPGILGHRHPEYVESLKDFLDVMSTAVGSGVLFSTDDAPVAEMFTRHVPCAEKLKYSITGTEAVQMAIRLARAYTGRPYFIRFGGHYHGWMDNVLGGTVDANPQGKPYAVDDPDSDPFTDFCYTRGKSEAAVKESFLLPWNDLEAVERTLAAYGEDVAMIHLEPLICNHFNLYPRPGFLEGLRRLCDKYGVLLSFDEVITGFRLGLSGAQGYFGVTPDLATFGKAMAGGVPFSAVAGRADIMDQLAEARVLGPGTFNGYPLGMRAVRTTIEILQRDDGSAYREMARIQSRLTSGLKEIAGRRGIPLSIPEAPGVFFTIFGLEQDDPFYVHEELSNMDFNTYLMFWAGMQENGVITLAGGRWYPSIAHNDADVDWTLEAADKVMAGLASG